MRIKSNFSEIKEYCPGKVTLILDTDDDLWHFYNVLYNGDLIQIKTTRKVTHETGGGGKSVKKQHIFVTLKISNIEYDSEGTEIRVKGKNVSESDFLSIGQFQSATLTKGIQFSIIKRSWDPFSIEKMTIASNPTLTSDLAVCLMEEGIANIFLVSSHITINKAKVELSVPKKRKGATQHDKSLEKFFSYVLDAIIKNINFDIVKCLVVGTPGFVKDQFSTYINEKLVGNLKDYDLIKKNIKKFFFVHASSAYKHSLNELLSKPEVLSQITNTKASEDVAYMNKYDKILSTDYEKVIFGLKQLQIAIDNKAIDFLLVTDDYLRKLGPYNRKEMHKKFIEIETQGGIVKYLSSMHPTGQRVNNLGGITGVVKFIIPELETMDEDYNDIADDHVEESEKDEDLKELIEGIEDMEVDDDEEEEKDNNNLEALDIKKNKPSNKEKKERDQKLKKNIDRKKSTADEDF